MTAPSTTNIDDTHMSVHLRNLLLTNFTPEQLRSMATYLEESSPEAAQRRRWREMLDDADFVELADMIIAGKLPSLGWWRRHRRQQQ